MSRPFTNAGRQPMNRYVLRLRLAGLAVLLGVPAYVLVNAWIFTAMHPCTAAYMCPVK